MLFSSYLSRSSILRCLMSVAKEANEKSGFIALKVCKEGKGRLNGWEVAAVVLSPCSNVHI